MDDQIKIKTEVDWGLFSPSLKPKKNSSDRGLIDLILGSVVRFDKDIGVFKVINCWGPVISF